MCRVSTGCPRIQNQWRRACGIPRPLVLPPWKVMFELAPGRMIRSWEGSGQGQDTQRRQPTQIKRPKGCSILLGVGLASGRWMLRVACWLRSRGQCPCKHVLYQQRPQEDLLCSVCHPGRGLCSKDQCCFSSDTNWQV